MIKSTCELLRKETNFRIRKETSLPVFLSCVHLLSMVSTSSISIFPQECPFKPIICASIRLEEPTQLIDTVLHGAMRRKEWREALLESIADFLVR